MQPSPSRFFRFVRVCRTGLLLLALSALGAACDRHSAAEVPESYGHGSTHEPDYTSHQVDSRQRSNHFSDTRGTDSENAEGTAPESQAAPKPGETPATTPNPMGIGR